MFALVTKVILVLKEHRARKVLKDFKERRVFRALKVLLVLKEHRACKVQLA